MRTHDVRQRQVARNYRVFQHTVTRAVDIVPGNSPGAGSAAWPDNAVEVADIEPCPLTETSAGSRLRVTAGLAAGAAGFALAEVSITDGPERHVLVSVGGPAVRGTGAQLADHGSRLDREVLHSAQPVYVGDLAGDGRYPGSRGAWLGVPLRSRAGFVVGVLSVSSPSPRPVGNADADLLMRYALVAEDQLDLQRRNREQGLGDQAAVGELVDAIDNGEIVPWYQPVVELATGRVASYEALARWQRPDGTILSPERFLPDAEDSDVVIDMDLAVAERALLDLRGWQRDRPGLGVNLNVSPRHFAADDALADLRAVIDDVGIAVDAITIELTETHRLADLGAAGDAVAQLRAAGFAVVLDDFGNGWSSLDWMLTLPVSGLKVDRSVGGALGRPVGDAILRGLTNLAAELDFTLTLEGLDDVGHVDLARAYGCCYGQGYFWSRPVPAPRVDAA